MVDGTHCKLLQAQAAQRRDTLDRFTGLVVGRRGSGRDADRQPAAGQPPLTALFCGMDTDRAVPDAPVLEIDARGVFDVVCRNLLVANGGEVRGVARVVPADHYHQVERLSDELEYRVLPLLRRRADRVEGAEVLVDGGVAPAAAHALAHFGRNCE